MIYYLKYCKSNYSKNWLLFVLISILLSGCSNIKHLKEGDELYTGAELSLNADEKIFKKLELSSELESLIKPDPNATFLGLRPQLWIYNQIDSFKRKKGIKNYLKNKIGRPPVLYNDDIPLRNVKSIKGELLSNGYLNATVNSKIQKRKKKVNVIYNVFLNKPYTIDTLIYQIQQPTLEKKIVEALNKTKLKAGLPFKIGELEEERTRISQFLKNEGFYYFNENYLIFKVDSTQGSNTVKILLQTKKEIPHKAFERQTINNIYVYADYTLEKDGFLNKQKAEYYDSSFYYIDPEKQFKPKVISKTIFFRKEATYRISNHDLTLKRLSDLKVFKFINVQLKETDSTKVNSLDVFIYLTPYLPRSIRLEVEATSKSNNFIGPGILADIRNRNFLHGAELLILHLNAGFESQLLNKSNNLNSFELGTKLSLTFPKFILPFVVDFSKNQEIPKTSLSLGFHHLNRTGFYSVNTASASFGYRWNESKEKTHEIKPLNINYLNLGDTTAAFNKIFKENPGLAASLKEQFIAGLTYSFQYTNQLNKSFGNYIYFKGNADIAGNILNLYSKTLTKQKEKPKTVLGLPYAQYAKFDIDFRYSFQTSNSTRLLTRFIAGIGIPYGNGSVLPYTKQFFIGGSNSIRAFRTRTLGPGTYKSNDTNSLFLDQSGDIKLEANIEYRYVIYKLLKGAFFLDNGNIWLIKNINTEKVFKPNTFLDQMAIGTGAGIRIDASFFVLRLDWAFPLRIPYNDEGNRWVIEDIRIEKKDWRRKNLVLNVAIGYPF